jgi:NAD(P)H-hydrate epimerase
MIKILNSRQVRELDAFTIKHEPIVSVDLMERACNAFVRWFTGQFEATHVVGIVCGTGNNGGDGLGIARLLSDWGYKVSVWIIKGENESEDFKANLHRLPEWISKTVIEKKPEKNTFDQCTIIIDAIFGSGLSRPVEGLYLEVIDLINGVSAEKVAVDIPSGLFADQHTNGVVLVADYTVTFQLPKLSFLLPENEKFIGHLEIVDIGLSKQFIREATVNHYMIGSRGAAQLLKPRKRFSHKGDFGKALLIAGSKGKMGACVLAGRAAMRGGLGLLTVHVPRIGYGIIQTASPEAMVSLDKDEELFSSVPDLQGYNSIGIGPGIGTHAKTIKAFRQLLETSNIPLVIDADALNIISENKEMIQLIPKESILTPHPGEFRRLVGDWENDFDKLEKAKQLAATARCIIVLKGAYTAIITSEGDIFFNSTGNPGMATGGSGDVLTGILTALLAGPHSPNEAALLGVHLHGLAGDRAAASLGMEAMIASDIIDHLPEAFKKLERQ